MGFAEWIPRNPLLLIALLGCPNAAPADSAAAERPHAEGCASGSWYADADLDFGFCGSNPVGCRCVPTAVILNA